MVFFNKTQTQTQTQPNSGVLEPEKTEKRLELTQVEAKIHQLAEKIDLGREKNSRLIQTQKQKLEQLQKEFQILNADRSASLGFLNGGGTKDPETIKATAKRVEELNGQVADKKGQIDHLELDILLLQQQKDEELIIEMLKEWNSYEKEKFQNNISPLFRETVAAKTAYFEKLKQLRSHYVDMERLGEQINSTLGDADKVTVPKWFDVTLKSPEILITKHDEQKEETITHTYLAE